MLTDRKNRSDSYRACFQPEDISNMAVGYNNIDINEVENKGIMVMDIPGVLTETTADLTFALLMATARRLIESSN